MGVAGREVVESNSCVTACVVDDTGSASTTGGDGDWVANGSRLTGLECLGRRRHRWVGHTRTVPGRVASRSRQRV
ncbi:hypothetical protein M5689_011141 [Euphorbia peplus]|nr:hypothetical protein M5689_011141 [Euphorbia peplus]